MMKTMMMMMMMIRLSDESTKLQVAAADMWNTCSLLHTVYKVAIFNWKLAKLLHDLWLFVQIWLFVLLDNAIFVKFWEAVCCIFGTDIWQTG